MTDKGRGVAIPPDCHSLDNAHFVVTQWNRDKSESFNITLRINAVKNLVISFATLHYRVTRFILRDFFLKDASLLYSRRMK
jgi:hypothetical protein